MMSSSVVSGEAAINNSMASTTLDRAKGDTYGSSRGALQAQKGPISSRWTNNYQSESQLADGYNVVPLPNTTIGQTVMRRPNTSQMYAGSQELIKNRDVTRPESFSGGVRTKKIYSSQRRQGRGKKQSAETRIEHDEYMVS